MQSSNQLQDMLHSINRKSYPAYKSLKGAYQFKKYVLSIDHVQGDPFASPSHVSVKISHREAGFPAEYYKDKLTRITLADYLIRQFEQQVNRYTFRAKGSGKKMLAKLFAMTLQCENSQLEPCGECRSCRQADSGNQPDIITIQHEKAGVNQCRDIESSSMVTL